MQNERNLKEIHDQFLVMMKDLDRIFTENGIQYSLNAGTLLGCIREKGFIPWDDDVDYVVDRENLEKISRIMKDNPDYEFVRGSFLQKVIRRNDDHKDTGSLYVDLMVIDNLPSNPVAAKLKILLIKFIQGMLKDEPRFDGLGGVYKFLVAFSYGFGRLFTRRMKLRMYDAVSAWGNMKETEYVTITNDVFSDLSHRYRKEWFSSFERRPFENITQQIISGYDGMLTELYGDYMTPPKESDRVPGHSIEVKFYRD